MARLLFSIFFIVICSLSRFLIFFMMVVFAVHCFSMIFFVVCHLHWLFSLALLSLSLFLSFSLVTKLGVVVVVKVLVRLLDGW